MITLTAETARQNVAEAKKHSFYYPGENYTPLAHDGVLMFRMVESDLCLECGGSTCSFSNAQWWSCTGLSFLRAARRLTRTEILDDFSMGVLRKSLWELYDS